MSDNPTTKTVNLNAPGSRGRSSLLRQKRTRWGQIAGVDPLSRPHKPSLDEMGVASYHEVLPDRPGKKGDVGKRRGGEAPHFPDLDSMGPGTESIPYREAAPEPKRQGDGPRSSAGKAGSRGGWTAKKFRK